MPNTSATGGILSPISTPIPVNDLDLTRVLQSLVAGMTGIPGNLVRPRWQPQIANAPENDVDWAAIGVTNDSGDWDAYVEHVPTSNAGAGTDLVYRQEELDVLVSFYGPNAQRSSGLMRDGFSVAQNRESMFLAGMSFVGCGKALVLPVQINTIWYNRYDIPFTIRRTIARLYSVLNLQTANGSINTDTVPPQTRVITVTNS